MCNCFVEIQLQQYRHLESALVGNKRIHPRHPLIAGKMSLSLVGSWKAYSLNVIVESARDELPRLMLTKQFTCARLVGNPEYCHYWGYGRQMG